MSQLKARIAKLPYALLSVMAALAAFGTYTCMYAFRKAFAAGTYSGQQYFNIDYKVWLVIAQVLGYTMSKFYGIRFIAEVKPENRAKSILVLIGISWLALLGFALIPAPYNIAMLLINGFPLGMIWGLVFGYLEGRRSTEFMAAVMSISLIFASGFVKTTGRMLMDGFHINEYFMPFCTGALFVIPLLFFVWCMELLPPPSQKDRQLRAERVPMSARERRSFFICFLPGIILTVMIYVMLTMMRDIRDNFEVEIWRGIGIRSNTIYTHIDTVISVVVLTAMSLLILVRKNLLAFSLIHLMIIGGCILAGLSTVMFNLQMIDPVSWMTMAGLGLYLGYVPYNAIFFERMIASFNYKSNVGFVMYIADAMGYLGSISILLIKELLRPGVSWNEFFKQGLLALSVIGVIGGLLSLLYFLQTANKSQKEKAKLKLYTA
jgi:MFS family permease